MARIPGEGLAKGLAVTFKHMVRKSVTQQYPEVQPDLPPRSRGVIALVEENCTVCMLCARECPDWCIYIDSHKETLPAPEGGRPRARNVLDRFAIDFSLCMYCGICVEVCPFDALFWAPEFEYAEYDIRDLLHEKERLGEWVESVPPPPPHEIGAEPPKEAAAASRSARGPAGQPPSARQESGRPTAGRPGESDRSAGSGRPGTADAVSASGTAGSADSGPSGTAGSADSGPSGMAETAESTGRPGGSGGGPRARREAPRGPAAIRAIRPPGALPQRSAAGAKPTEPTEPTGTTGPTKPTEPPAAGASADEESTGPESPKERSSPPGPGTPSTHGTSTHGTSTHGTSAQGTSAQGTSAQGTSTGGESAGDASTGGQPTGAGSPAEKERSVRREPPSPLRNVRSIRPPGSLPKKDAPPDQGGES
ncbi:4Fe-4S binding protein [Microtetraspora sp. NBRC 16547]|uniref:NuoI/complex I 23 kDa subunit family protein n=1 Tax=Microtetraspora sp. NBRC 16547 TaxID=3030993 RepID=UPI0024A22E77|nr:4Fe-4S binding protein [Microtetraspora sp. NBRC 16547]GLW99562.1 hypothetical protein Misp02_36490 [Microtetraspora sp. NBRC 16547]